MATIRPATPTDCPDVHSLICELAEFEKIRHLVASTPADLHDALFVDSPAAECLVADSDGHLAGFALFFQNYSSFSGKRGMYLEDLYVQPQHRGNGLGKQLMNAVIQCAHNRKCPRLDWCVLDWNENAIRFYEELGADVMPEWRIARLTNP